MKKTVIAFVFMMLVTVGSLSAFAQPPAAAPGQGDFVPVNSLPQTEQLPAAPFVIAAYAFVWVALLVYVWSIWRRMRKIEQELADLRSRITSQ